MHAREFPKHSTLKPLTLKALTPQHPKEQLSFFGLPTEEVVSMKGTVLCTYGGVYGNFPKEQNPNMTPKQAPPIWGTPHIGGELGCRGVPLRPRRDSTRRCKKGFLKLAVAFLAVPISSFIAFSGFILGSLIWETTILW